MPVFHEIYKKWPHEQKYILSLPANYPELSDGCLRMTSSSKYTTFFRFKAFLKNTYSSPVGNSAFKPNFTSNDKTS